MHLEQETPHSRFKEVMIVAGEASGDLHGFNLVKAMHRIDPRIRFYGIGGEKLREAGVEIVANSSEMAVVGLTEVLSKLGFILKVRRKLKKFLQEKRPDLLILIDYPDFNLPLAKEARKNGVKVFYYISPQVWAWRKGRIHTIAKLVDRMAVILPFEAPIYERVKLDVSFVGHPLLDAVKRKYTREEALQKFDLRDGITTVGILPGSRDSEVMKLLPEMLKAAEILEDRQPSVQFVLPLADTLNYDFVADIVSQYSANVKIVKDDVYDVIGLSDIAMVASGTATLETALLGTPMVIVYKISTLSYLIGRAVVNVDNIGLVNIIAGKTVVPELIQGDANPEKMADEVYNILTSGSRMDEMKKELLDVSKKLGGPGASERTARLACEMILK
ncbi:MAG: lipid-A-disaccharide synthase [Deltaproteobacteria bacterium]|nr:lipid-A-disaccharide synthase [Deltaproteobacteria bacterium]